MREARPRGQPSGGGGGGSGISSTVGGGSAVDEVDEGPVDAEPEVVAEVEESPEVGGENGDSATLEEEAIAEDVDVEVEEGRRGGGTPSRRRSGRSIRGAEGARLIALNMALNGTPRDETARYLSQNFDLDDQDALLDEVYARVGD